MNFKKAINQTSVLSDAPKQEEISTKVRSPTPKRVALHGRPYGTFFITPEYYPGYSMSPWEWRREYSEDVEYHFSTLLKVINKYFPKKLNDLRTSELFQEFEKFAFENSTGS